MEDVSLLRGVVFFVGMVLWGVYRFYIFKNFSTFVLLSFYEVVWFLCYSELGRVGEVFSVRFFVV